MLQYTLKINVGGVELIQKQSVLTDTVTEN